MVELGCLKIFNSDSVVEARKKARQASLKLGCTEIMSTRIEAVLSEIGRLSIQDGGAVDVTVLLSEINNRQGIEFLIDNMETKENVSFADMFFDAFTITEKDNGKCSISAFMAFKSNNPELTADCIDEIRRDIALPSREELMNEVTRKNEELASSRQFLQSVLDNIQSVVYAKDLDGRYTYMNNEWEKVMEHDRDASIGRRDIELFSKEIGQKYQENDIDVMQSKKVKKIEEHFVNRNGQEIIFLSTKVPMIQGDGIIGLCGISTDITEIKHMEKELFQAKEIAEDAAKSKADFLANMSHEIRTPMNAILGMTYLIQKTELTPKQRDYVDKTSSSGHHLLGIINDILDFSKIEAGKLDIEQANFRLEEVLDNLSNLISEKCLSKGLELVFDIHADVPVNLVGDPLRIGQILINYANNAVKFTDAGEIIVRVRKLTETGKKCFLRFEVQDSGIGLTDEQMARLFQSFQQADTSTTRKYGGTGLGLAISKKLANLMGGEVGVESKHGNGSSFWFTCSVGIGERTKRISALDKFRNMRVLVVDDNEHARIILCDILKTMGLRADEAPSGILGVHEIVEADTRNDPYSVVYMDMQMPGLNGIQTVSLINTLKLSQRPQCIMVTAYGREEVYTEAQNVGIALVLVKPVTASSLFESTLRVLSGIENTVFETSQTDEMPKQDYDLTTIAGACILLVEDNEINQQVAMELLDEGDFIIDLAENGEIAVRMVGEKTYDLVLMDMQMPVMDGLEATRLIRMDPNFKNLPIIAMTANAMTADRENCVTAGMNDHLAKPIEPDVLFKKLLKWIPQRQSSAESGRIKPETGSELDMVEEALEIIIPGLNTELGLRRVLGKRKSYLNLLKKYVSGQKDTFVEMEKALASGDLNTAERLAHTLKAVSANIGAEDIQADAAELEAAIRSSCTGDSFMPLIEKTASKLAEMIEQLEEALPKEEQIQAVQSNESSVDELMKMLQVLRPHIEGSKPKRCAELLVDYRKLTWPLKLQDDASELDRITSKYRFREALAYLDALSEKLQEGGIK